MQQKQRTRMEVEITDKDLIQRRYARTLIAFVEKANRVCLVVAHFGFCNLVIRLRDQKLPCPRVHNTKVPFWQEHYLSKIIKSWPDGSLTRNLKMPIVCNKHYPHRNEESADDICDTSTSCTKPRLQWSSTLQDAFKARCVSLWLMTCCVETLLMWVKITYQWRLYCGRCLLRKKTRKLISHVYKT